MDNMKRKVVGKRILFLVLSCITFATVTWAKDEHQEITARIVTMQAENISLAEAFGMIRKETGLTVFYGNQLLDDSERVSFNFEGKRLNEVLDFLLEDKGIWYELRRNKVIVLERLPDRTETEPSIKPTTGVPVNPNTHQVDVTGIVSDEQGPVANVTVMVQGTGRVTSTDEAGRYRIAAASDEVLLFRRLGYVEQQIPVGESATINVILVEQIQDIDEVVVVGYGEQKKVNLTGSVTTIKSEELVKRSAPNTSLLLQGKVPGLQVVQNSAQPGMENASLQIRGQGTFSAAGNEPLVIIDGVQGSLASLNPNMIESITVLKDASSAAIYGVQGANGVILVTTKAGNKGKMRLEYAYNYGIQRPAGVPDLIWNSVEFMELNNEGINRTGQNLAKLYSPEQIEAYRNGAGSPQFPNTNWTDLMFNNAGMQQHFLSVNGGEGNTVYNFGLGYLDQQGILMNTGYEKYNTMFNFQTKLNDFVSFGSNINLMYGDRHDPVDNSENLVLSIYAQHPLWSPYLPDGSGRVSSKAYDFETTNQNAYVVMETSKDRNKEYNVSALSYIKLNLAKNLVGEVRGATRFNSDRQTAQRVPIPTFLFQPDGNGVHTPQQNYLGNFITLRKTQQESVHYTFFSTLTYDETFGGKHHVTALAGYNQENRKYEQQEGFRRDFPSSELLALDAGGTDAQTANGYGYDWALQSFFGRVNYAFDNRYLFEASLRYDGSSKFRKGNKWGVFPSFSGGWRISEEPFLSNVSWLTELKIRGSWGKLGNQNVDNYPYQNLLDYGLYVYDNVTTGVVHQNLVDADITWETTQAAGVGVDFSLWNGMLSGTVDYFNKNTTNILRKIELPDFVGLGAPTVNSGEMNNKGIEADLRHRNKVGNVIYSLGANFYSYKNEVVKFGPEEIQSNKIRKEGLPWNSWYMLEWIGVFQNTDHIAESPVHQNNPKPGDLIFADRSGPNGEPDGRIDPYDRVAIDGQHPAFTYGFNFAVEYKGFDLSVFFQGVEGRKIFTSDWGYGAFRQWSPPPTFWRNRWTPDNPTNKLPGMYVDNYQPITVASSFWLQDASYLRLKNLILGYSLPSQFLDRIKLKNLRVYFSGDNLLTFTKFIGDPERVIQDNTSGRFAIYPQANLYTIGVNVTF